MSLSANPTNPAAETALAIYADVLAGVRADRLVSEAVRRESHHLAIQDLAYDLSPYRRIFVCGSGKAAVGMATPLVEMLGSDVAGGLLVTKHGHGEDLPGLEVIEAGHPVPDEGSLAAGRRMLEYAAETRERDLILYVLSGGSSSLLEAPVEGIDLEDLQVVNRALLASGADIEHVNTVRSALSRIKGGGLAEAFGRATVCVLVLSDVAGNDLRVIGSGPFYQGTDRSAAQVLRHYDIEARIGAHLAQTVRAAARTPRPKVRAVPHRIVGDVSTAIRLAVDSAVRRGLTAFELGSLSGEAREVGTQIAAFAKSPERLPETNVFIAGGETVVTVTGDGRGGRCQELAVAAAREIHGHADIALLAGSTDGTDGPTEAGAALVDGGSESRAQLSGLSAARALANNDSYPYLEACGGLVITGPTQSNVNDIVIAVRAM